MPKVSIITVCRNEMPGIRRTLESISSQTYTDFEHLIIDGDSNDGTKDVIKEFQKTTAYFVSEADSGIYAAQNKGIRQAQGEYLLFINGGDALHDKNVLQDVFSIEQTADIVYGDLLIEELDGTETIGYSPSEITLDFMLRGTLWHPVSFIHRRLFEEFGLYNENLKIAADYEFFIKTLLVNEGRTSHVNRVISRFNLDGIGSSPSTAVNHQKERDDIQKTYFSMPVLHMFRELEKYRLHIEHLNQLSKHHEHTQKDDDNTRSYFVRALRKLRLYFSTQR